MDWISVKDRLPSEMPDNNPKNGWSISVRPSEYVLCMTDNDIFKGFYSYSFQEWIRYDETATYTNVTHWQPLPQAAKGGLNE